jgi:hypothetical protein
MNDGPWEAPMVLIESWADNDTVADPDARVVLVRVFFTRGGAEVTVTLTVPGWAGEDDATIRDRAMEFAGPVLTEVAEQAPRYWLDDHEEIQRRWKSSRFLAG